MLLARAKGGGEKERGAAVRRGVDMDDGTTATMRASSTYMLGDHVSRPMCPRPLHSLSSTAPASHIARVSVAMMAPSSKKSERFHVAPYCAGGVGKEKM